MDRSATETAASGQNCILNQKPPATYQYVDDAEGLKALTARLTGARRVALDIEANSLYRYFQRVCLIQLSFDGENYIVDPLAELDYSDFVEALAEKPLIVHGGDYDLRMMRSSLHFEPRAEVFDTMLAAKILGIEEMGLVALAHRFLGVTLSKRGQKSNWTRRPLAPEQLDYATDDTRFLEAIADKMIAELDRLGRREWHRENCARMVESALQSRNGTPDPEEGWRIKGSSFLEPNELVYLRQIWLWRDREARRTDRPPFKILGNTEVLELAKWAAAHPGVSVQKGPRLPRSVSGGRLEALDQAVRKAHHTPPSKWPQQPKRRNGNSPEPPCRKRMEALQAECARMAEELGISPSVLAPRTALAAIARSRATTCEELMESGSLSRWQAGLLMPAYERIFGKPSRESRKK